MTNRRTIGSLTDNTKPKVAELEIIGTNHLGFAKSLFQQYSQQLGLNNNYYSAVSAFNFYVNERITDFLGRPVDIESARKNFYLELIQHTNLPKNHSFALIIREINQKIEKYTQRTFSITYQNKGKGKLQTSAVTPKEIQIPNWKKQRIESLIYPSYHYMSGSTINITSADASTSTKMPLVRIAFQSKQKKNKLLGAYSNYFEGFKSRLPIPSGFQLPSYQPDFRTISPWEIIESEEKEDKDQEFNYQNPILENPNIQTQQHLENSEIKTPNIRTCQIKEIKTLIPPQQPLSFQQSFQQPPQPPNLDPMAYAPIAKLNNFISEEDNAQVWLNDVEKAIAANRWNNAQAMQTISYFLKDTINSYINCLVNTFTTMKQRETEAVTTYLGHFHRNLCQIQTIDANYFTAPQILNQFIRGLHSSILQHVCLLHPGTLQDAVTCAKDFESTKLEANHTQAVNLVMNGSSELDSKLEKFKNSNCGQNQPRLSSSTNQQWQQKMHICHYCDKQGHIQINCHQLLNSESSIKLNTISNYLLANDAAINLSTISISSFNLSTNGPNLSVTATGNISTTTANNLSTPNDSDPATKLTGHQTGSCQWNSGTGNPQNPNSQNYLSLLVTPENASPSNQKSTQKQQTRTSNILPATVTNDKLLNTIFPFEFEELSTMSLFSGAALENKPVTIIYTDAKIDGHLIKLILDSGLAGSIIT
ncbi:hypothetical protein G9A89_006122 [Geosiphon pyriformis]|nr:hypothetical protein G9A89_006122 [Geosiphon pyriformis]